MHRLFDSRTLRGRVPAGQLWDTLKQSKVARNTISMLAGSTLRMLLQAVYFIFVARSLGPGQYGIFVGAISLIAVLSPFSTWGTGNILIRNVARQKESFRRSWGAVLWITAIFSSLMLGAVVLLWQLIFSNRTPLSLICLVGLSDLIFAGIVTLASQVFAAFEMLGKTATQFVVLSACRATGAVAMFVLIPHPTAASWALIYLGTTAISAVYGFVTVSRFFGYPHFFFRVPLKDLREGFYFSLGLSSQSVYNNIDKTMLVRLASAASAGIYATAYRIIDLAFQPITSLLYSTYARFFQHGVRGIKGTSTYARLLLPFVMGYGVVAGAFLFLAAPLLPIVLGRQFSGADDALRWLSPLLLFRATHYLLSDSLTGAQLQGLRSAIQVGIAVLNVGLDLWLIPLYSWRGAAWASLASDGILMVAVGTAVMILNARVDLLGPAKEVPVEGAS
jgi:O-antigen/teichoic acid export membrane protein